MTCASGSNLINRSFRFATAASEIGEYWDKETQIDVVGLRQDGWTDLGECKWGTVRSATALRAELEARLPHFPNQRHATVARRFFTRARVKVTVAKGTNERWHTLDDLYEAAEEKPANARNPNATRLETTSQK